MGLSDALKIKQQKWLAINSKLNGPQNYPLISLTTVSSSNGTNIKKNKLLNIWKITDYWAINGTINLVKKDTAAFFDTIKKKMTAIYFKQDKYYSYIRFSVKHYFQCQIYFVVFCSCVCVFFVFCVRVCVFVFNKNWIKNYLGGAISNFKIRAAKG